MNASEEAGNGTSPAAEPVEAPADCAAQSVGARSPLGALVATDRHGSLLARLSVGSWPVLVGRALDADLVLDDAHVAQQHLRLTQGAPGHVTVQVLDTINGVTLAHKQHARGAVFDWPVGQPLVLGRLHLRVRLADAPAGAELPLVQLQWRSTGWSFGALALALVMLLGQWWLKTGETQKFLQEMPLALLGALAAVATWAGLWALATKLFSGQPQFWRHVRITCLTLVAGDALELATRVGAFAFSWESIERFSPLVVALVVATGIYRQLLVVAPHPRRNLAVGVVIALLLGLPALLGPQWLKNKRLSNQLYLAHLFPPGWRIAAPVPVAQFLREAASIEGRLALRLKDREDQDASDKAADDDE